VQRAYKVLADACARRGYRIYEPFSPSRLGYLVEAPWAARPVRPEYDEDPLDGASVLGLGPFARSVCRERLVYQNRTGWRPGLSFAPSYEGFYTSRDEALRGPSGQVLRVRLAPSATGVRAFRERGGWAISYQGSFLPPEAAEALDFLLDREISARS